MDRIKSPVKKPRSLLSSFRFAVRGISHCVRYERNFRIHLVAAAFVLYFAHFFPFSALRWMILLLTVAAVLLAEMLNTAVERISDMLSPQYSRLARLSKDIAAGAVLLIALVAVAIGIIFFWDAAVLAEIAVYFTGAWYRLPLLLLAAAVGLIFIFPKKSGEN